VLPVATGVVAGIAAVSLGFGQVHGMTLGFGTTLIGEAVDYAIYYLIQARGGDGAAERWRRDSWPTVRLGLFTSLIGFAALVFTGFPGLAQLGVFSIAGLVAAAATTRFVFPVLVPNGAPGAGFRRQLARFMSAAASRLPRARWGVVAVALASIVALVVTPSPWHGELSSLSPVSASDLALDAALRADVGAADAGALVAIAGVSEQAALEGAEAIGARLDRLVAAGVLQGYDSPARLLPSAATQARRLAALPDATTLATRLAEATADGALPAARLAPFIADVEAARAEKPFGRAALAGTPLASALDALLLPGDATRPWRALVNLQAGENGRIDVARVRAAIADVPGVRVVAIRAELDAIYARFLREAEWQAALGAVAVALLLAWHLRSARRLAAIALPIAAATLLVLAALAVSGAALGILHLVGLLLTVAIGSNYALFFDHLRERARPTPTPSPRSCSPT
jgi:predicted exporter